MDYSVECEMFACCRKHNDCPAPAVRNSVQVALCIGYGLIEEQNDRVKMMHLGIGTMLLTFLLACANPFVIDLPDSYLNA